MKKSSGDNYSAWLVKDVDFPNDGSIEVKIRFFIRYGILAPSTHNTQPWQFKISGNILEIFPNLKKQLPQADPIQRDLYISLGCCVQNILIAADYFGYKADWKINNNEQPSIELDFSPSQQKMYDTSLFKNIMQRFSYKGQYAAKSIDKKLLDDLEQRIDKSSSLVFITEEVDINKVASFYEEAAIRFIRMRRFRTELWSWTRPNNTRLGNGMPGFVLGLSLFQSIVGRRLLKIFPGFGIMTAKKYRPLIEASPAIGIISTSNDSPSAWINAGMTYEILALTAVEYGLNSSPLSAIIEDAKIRKVLEEFLKEDNAQIFFRIGYPPSGISYHTPREDIAANTV